MGCKRSVLNRFLRGTWASRGLFILSGYLFILSLVFYLASILISSC